MVVSKMEITTLHGAIDGKTQTMEAKFYNLDSMVFGIDSRYVKDKGIKNLFDGYLTNWKI